MEKTMTPYLFETAQNIIKNSDGTRIEKESVYPIADAYWQCYLILRSCEVHKITPDILRLALSAIRSAIGRIGAEQINEKLLPQNVKGDIAQKAFAIDRNNIEFLAQVESLIKDKNDDTLGLIIHALKKYYLIVVLAILQTVKSTDILSLINQCIVYDHLGNQAYSHTHFLHLLTEATERAKSAIFDSKKKTEVYFYLGMLNYRLNKYQDAQTLLLKYVESQIAVGIEDNARRRLADVFISIAYCYEKINDEKSIDRAINILEAIRKDCPIDVFGKTSFVYNNGRNLISMNALDKHHRIEIHHALAHFYNERAVFHMSSSPNVDDDLKKSRDYISIAKNMDDENSLHSCHGLICFENNDYHRAAAIYKEALALDAVAKNESLKNELLIYLAQTETTLFYDTDLTEDDIDKINEKWESFKQFAIGNNDALAQYYIIKIKTELSGLKVYDKDMEYFRTALSQLLEHNLSHYVPSSVSDERKRLILTLNTFYALRGILDGKVSFVDGIEEAFFNLVKYLNEINNQINYSNFTFDSDAETNISDLGTIENDDLFIIKFKGLSIACFGDYHQLAASVFPIEQCWRLTFDNETNIVAQIKSNRRVDVVIFAPTKNLSNNSARLTVLKKILDSGVCLVAIGQEAERIANNVQTAGVSNSAVFCAKDKNEALQMAICFGLYELMRKNLLSPTPMLGLAPLVESKSYTFQAGKALSELLPPLVAEDFTQQDIDQKNILTEVIQKLDAIQQGHQDRTRYLDDYQSTLEYYTGLLSNRVDVSLVAFFPEEMTDKSDISSLPYMVQNESILYAIKYICPAKMDQVYNLASIFKKINGQIEVSTRLRNARRRDGFCSDPNCRPDCRALCISLADDNTGDKLITTLLNNLFSIQEINQNVCCICTSVQYKNKRGILLIVTKYTNVRTAESVLRQICRLVHDGKAGAVKKASSGIGKSAISPVEKEKKSMSVTTTKDSNFTIGVSFKGSDCRTSIVKPVMNELLNQGFSKDNLFFDEWHDHLIVGERGNLKLGKIYKEKCSCIIVFLSSGYNDGKWTGGVEWKQLQSIFADRNRTVRVCLLRVDGVDIDKIDWLDSNTDIVKDVSSLSPNEIVDFILRWYKGS